MLWVGWILFVLMCVWFVASQMFSHSVRRGRRGRGRGRGALLWLLAAG